MVGEEDKKKGKRENVSALTAPGPGLVEIGITRAAVTALKRGLARCGL